MGFSLWKEEMGMREVQSIKGWKKMRQEVSEAAQAQTFIQRCYSQIRIFFSRQHIRKYLQNHYLVKIVADLLNPLKPEGTGKNITTLCALALFCGRTKYQKGIWEAVSSLANFSVSVLYHFIGKSDISWISEASLLTKHKSQRRVRNSTCVHSLIFLLWNFCTYLYATFALLDTCLTSCMLCAWEIQPLNPLNTKENTADNIKIRNLSPQHFVADKKGI